MRILVLACALACAASVTARAQAVPSFTLDRATLGGGLRFGSDDLNVGIGARGGYTLNQGIYIGGLFDYWFGESNESTNFVGVQVSDSYSVWDLMVVVGYDAGVTPTITIRPFGGFGIVHVDREFCGQAVFIQGCQDDSESDLGAVLGGEALFDLGGLHVGPEIRILIFEETAFVIGGNIGGTF